ncbi:hypothetical protein V493_03916 [Pseudogymnoascus sp. VKM F-4281 (FW-2241)]|nr:hypothetical protein V493_03916 [Pseudogymnoascus sp. VKM F-4281 (FW-2241)]
MNLFRAASRTDAQWLFVGLASAFLDVEQDGANLSQSRACNAGFKPGCKAFYTSNEDSENGSQNHKGLAEADLDESSDLKSQILVFQYKGKFHAIDHQCPHSSFPLSQGTLFDIEDFGVVLSAGLTCPKHEWSFDLFTGTGDRGNYRLKIWEVQLRGVDGSDKEVWLVGAALTPSQQRWPRA